MISCKIPLVDLNKNMSFKDLKHRMFSQYQGDRTNLYANHVKYGDKNNYKFLVKWVNQNYDEVSWEDEYLCLKFPEVLKKYDVISYKLKINGHR